MCIRDSLSPNPNPLPKVLSIVAHWDCNVAHWLEHRTVTPLTQVRFPGAARDFLPRVNFQCRLSFGVRTPPCAIACINICAHVKDPVVHVRVQWIMTTQTHPACTISDKNNQLDDCGRSSAMSMLLQHEYIRAL